MQKVKNLWLVFFALILSFSNAFSIDGGFVVEVSQNRTDSYDIQVNLKKYQINAVEKNGVHYSQVGFPGAVSLKKNGWADLPYLGVPIQLPDVKNVDVEIIHSEYVDIPLDYPMIPSRGIIYRNQDPDEIPYETNPESIVDAWYPEHNIETTDPYILRKVRGESILLYPFQYNAVSQTLRVFTSFQIRVVENNDMPINPLPENLSGYNQEMLSVYESVFVNFSAEQYRWSNEIEEFGDILVVYTSRDADAIQPWIEWKQQKGYHVDELEVSTGTNVVSQIQSAYNSNNNLLYVLLVGDWADIKTDLGPDSAPTDPMAGCVVGTDDYHDIIVGRFSASTSAHVTAQVNKSIAYEKTPDIGGTWYTKALGIASNEGPGDDSEYDYDQISNIHDGRLLPSTYTNCYEEFDPGASATGVANYINDGVSVINYCGHGGHNYWVSSSYSTTHASSATNGTKLPFVFSVACIVGEFHTGADCLAESLLRNANGGALVTWMSTINQPWQPPMRGQDYANDLLVQGYNYSTGFGNGTNTTYGRTTFGSIAFNAAALMVSESSGTDDWDTYKTWTIFGDPSVQVRTDQPKEVSLSNLNVSPSTYNTQVQVGGTGFEGAIVSLWQDGSQPASAMTDATGNVSINHSFTGTVKLTVTGFNLATYHEDHVVAVPDPPVCDFSADDTEITAGESIQFTDLSTNYPSVWNWSFEGGTPDISNEQNPVVTYTNPGTYNVSLYVENNAGDDNHTKTDYITVNPITDPPVSDFVADETEVPIGTTVNFSDLSSNMPDEWTWIFEGGDPATSSSQNPSIVYNTPGTYSVTLTASNEFGVGNTESKTAYITVVLPDYCDAGSQDGSYEYISNVVLGDINNSSGASTYSNYSDQETEAYPEDVIDVTVSIADAYTTDKILIWADWNRDGDFEDTGETIYSSPNGQGPFITSVTVPAGVTSGPVRVRIRLEDTQYSPTGSACGFSGYGEVEDYTISILNNVTPPQADFSASPLTIYEGETVVFTDLSTDATSWEWEFGDSNSSNEQHPNHVYSLAGTYTVSLTATNSIDSDVETKTDYITVLENTNPPVTDFEADNISINVGSSVQFFDLSQNNPSEWVWSFDGGTPSSSLEQNPVVIYNTPGIYTVSLTSANEHGTGNTEIKTDYITVTVGGFSMDFEECVDYSSDFSPWTVLDNDGAETYGSSDCDFPGESGALGFLAFNPVDAGFTLANTHGGDRVGMAICPTEGAADDWMISNQLSLGENSSFSLWVLSPKPGTWGNNTYEVLVSTTGNNPTDFTVISGATPVEAPETWAQHTYDLSDYDNEQIYLAVHHVSEGKFMFWVDDMEVVTEWPGILYADFEADLTSVEIGSVVTFTDLTEDVVTSWEWNFGDSGTSNDQNPQHTYTEVGTYTVQLTVSDGESTDSEIKLDYITVTEPAPTALFSAAPINTCDGVVQFSDESTGASSWLWDFGDGDTSDIQNPEYVYSENGIYTVSLTVTNTGGTDTYTLTDYITVEIPDASITPVGLLCLDSQAIILSATTEGGVWSGNGVEDGVFTPQDAGVGTHLITYEVTIGTCTDTDEIEIVVSEQFDATINLIDDLCETDEPILLSAMTDGGEWSGEGVDGNQFDPAIAGPGDHLITYLVGSGSCSDTDTEIVHVEALPEINITPVDPLCISWLSQPLEANIPGGEWSGNGVTSDQFIPADAGVGVHVITYTVYGEVCTASETIEIMVGNTPEVNVDITHASSSTASDGSVSATASNGLEPYSYHWSNGDTDNIMQDVQTGVYSLTVTDAAGCETVVDEIIVDFPFSIHEYNMRVEIYPNPANEIINIKLDRMNVESIQLIDVLGKVIVNQTVILDVNVLDVSGFDAGIYFIRIVPIEKEEAMIQKVMIQ
jgi:PKD repeat protein